MNKQGKAKVWTIFKHVYLKGKDKLKLTRNMNNMISEKKNIQEKKKFMLP